MGTPAYMAPEIILGRDDVDRRADVYAIGCVAFYLLTGTRVFQDGNQMQVLVDHVHTEPVPPFQPPRRCRCRARWTQLSSIVSRKDPNDRPQDAGEVLDRITASNLAGRWSNSGGTGVVAGPVTGAGAGSGR